MNNADQGNLGTPNRINEIIKPTESQIDYSIQ